MQFLNQKGNGEFSVNNFYQITGSH